MSLVVAVFVNDGIVLASDSRITFQEKVVNENNTTVFMGINQTDTGNKTHMCPNGVGISFAGDSNINGFPIAGFIGNFILEKITKTTRISDMPTLVLSHFKELEPNLNTVFLIAGYEEEISKNNEQQNIEKYTKKIYQVNINNDNFALLDTSPTGAYWAGEKFVLQKILKSTYLKNGDEYTSLPNYSIPWDLFTLQDAVHFVKYAVDVTSQTMRFMNVAQTVGGPVDILIIRPNKTEWLQKKELTV